MLTYKKKKKVTIRKKCHSLQLAKRIADLIEMKTLQLPKARNSKITVNQNFQIKVEQM
jgi:hypothetical protein